MTFVLIGLRRSGNFLRRSVRTKKGRNHALQALFPRCCRLLPAWKLIREFRSLGLPPLLFPALQVGRIRGGGLRVHLVLCPGRLPPLSLGLGLARGEGVSLDARRLHASAPLPLQLLRELVRWRLLVRSGRPLPAPLPWLLLPVPRRTLDNVGDWEKFRRTAPAWYPPVVPDLRIEEHGRIRELTRGRTALMTVAVILALAPLPVRGQKRRRRSSSWSLSSREWSRRTRSCSWGDQSRSSDRYRSRRDRSRRDRSRSSDRYRSCR